MNMQWKFEDGEWAGPIYFGESIKKLKEKYGEPDSIFKRTAQEKEKIFAYDRYGIYLNINEEGLVTQLTVFPSNEVFIERVSLLGKKMDSLHKELIESGVSVEREDAGLWCDIQKVLIVEVDGIADGIEIYSD